MVRSSESAQLCKQDTGNVCLFLLCYRHKINANVAQSVERRHGKAEVFGSIPNIGSRKQNRESGFVLIITLFEYQI